MIYFITDGEYIRVSVAEDPQKKLRDLQAKSPKPLQLLHTIEGDNKDKQALHKQLKEHKVKGEWFAPNDHLKRLIGYSASFSGSGTAVVSPPAFDRSEEKAQEKALTLASWQTELMRQQGTLNLLTQAKLTPDQAQAIVELPVYGVDAPRTVAAIHLIREQQRLGRFQLPAIFADALMQDPVIYSNLHTRVKALTGKPIELKPADESDKAKEIQEDCDKHFPSMVPIPEMESMLMGKNLLGQGLYQIMWDTSTDRKWMPTVRESHQKYLTYQQGIREYQLTTQSKGQITILPDDIQWGIFKGRSNMPWRDGMIIPLAMPWLMLNSNEQWWAKHQEKAGSSILQAITSAEATPAEEKAFAWQLYNLGNNGVVRTPQGVDGNKYDVKLHESQADMYTGFQAFGDYLARRVSMVVVGQDKTSMAKAGAGIEIGGSNAGELVRLDLMRSDANALAEHLREKILKNYVRFNYGDEYVELTPYISFDIEPPEDLNTKATAWKTLSDGLVNLGLAQQAALMIDLRAILENFELPLLEVAKAPNDLPDYQQGNLEPPDDLNEAEKVAA